MTHQRRRHRPGILGRHADVENADRTRTHVGNTLFDRRGDPPVVPVEVVDLTQATISYWELRKKSSVASGIEDAFLDAYTGGSFQYMLIAADRV